MSNMSYVADTWYILRNFFLDARSYYVSKIHTRKGNKTSVERFPSGLLKGKPFPATHTH